MTGGLNFLLRILAAFFLCLVAGNSFALENRLAQHPSPYLALHGSDPVAWQEWNAETVAKARRENKLLYVSVGYYACHWCHVMQRESYKNPEIAALLNRDFIPVKVDRELNTALDNALQDFSALLLKVAGWPLNAFVTPDGHPVFVMLYAPPGEFEDTLQRLAVRWKAQSAQIRKMARQAASGVVVKLESRVIDAATTKRREVDFLKLAKAEMDEFRGGFGQVSKFPMMPQLSLLLELQAASPDKTIEHFLRMTLDQMRTRGLHDVVNGGFFRYTTDPGWEIPHFEKMLYDNAQLALLYLRADAVLGGGYKAVAADAANFMIDVLESPEGGFYASTSAVDDKGREGLHYLWDVQALKKLLSASEYVVVSRVWKLDKAAPFEFGYLPAEWEAPRPGERALLESALAKMRKARSGWSLPKDTKRNAGLNGLALSAQSRLASTTDTLSATRYHAAATRTYRFIKQAFLGKAMPKSVSGKRKTGEAELEDYAYLAQGLLDYAELTGDNIAREQAGALLEKAWRLFSGGKGWKREAKPLLATMRPEAVLEDGALLSPSAVWIETALALDKTGAAGKGLRQSAVLALQWQSDAMKRDAFSYPSQIRAYRRFTALPAELPAEDGVRR